MIGVPDEHWGEVGRAVVVLRDGRARSSPQDLLAFLDGRIARYKIPKSVVFTDTLPRTASGKVVKKELRSRFTCTGGELTCRPSPTASASSACSPAPTSAPATGWRSRRTA